MFLDIHQDLFTREDKGFTRSSRGVIASRPASLRQYVDTLHEKCLGHNMMARAQAIAQLTQPDDDLVEKFDRDLGEFMQHADKVCKHRYSEPFSPTLVMARKKLKIFQLKISSIKLRMNFDTHIQRLQKEIEIPVTIPPTLAELERCKRAAAKELHDVVKEAGTHRLEHLQNQLLVHEAQGNLKDAKAVKRLIQAEEMRSIFQKLKYLRSDKRESSLKRVIVPVDPYDDPNTATNWRIIDEQRLVENTIFQRNRKHFGQAQGTPFTLQPLKSLVDFGASGKTSDYILTGDFTHEDLDDITHLVLKQMKAAATANTLSPEITMTNFIDKLKHWRESTYTNQKRHLGHYLALVKLHGIEDPDKAELFETSRVELLRLHLTLINYSLKFGYSLSRWQNSITIMIEKDIGDPKLHRLRVIHIYETDYNLLLGLKHRELIHHMHDNTLFHDGVFSNRPGFSALDPVFLEEMQHEYCRLTRFSQIKTDVDASACYDRIVPPFGSLNLRKYRMPPNVCLVQGKTLEEMKYNLQTGWGISLDHYKHNAVYPIYGTGQGSAGSPIIWVVILNTLLHCHDLHGHGAIYYNPDATKSTKFNVVGFVDDCSSQVTSPNPGITNIDALLQVMQQDAQLWRDLLFVSGGEFSHIKCSYHVTKFIFSDSGEPALDTTDDLPTININISGTPTPIKKLSPYSTHKTLGCHVAPSGNNGLKIMKKKSNTLALMLNMSDCTHRESWTFYISIYLTSITYSLSITKFSEKECEQLQSRATTLLLSKLGYNQMTARPLVYGPLSYGGFGMHHLFGEQGYLSLKMFIKFWRYDNKIGSLLRTNYQWLQIVAGVSFSLLARPNVDLPYLESKWLANIRKFLGKLKDHCTWMHPFQSPCKDSMIRS